MLPPEENQTSYGYRDELEALYLNNREMVLQAAYRVIQNKADAEDILQIVFQRLVERPDLRKGFRDNPKGYLYRAAINEALNLIGAQQREGWVDEDVAEFEMPAPAPNDDIHVVRAAMGTLKPHDREILYLFYYEGFECSEIGELRGRNAAAILMQLFRARRELKKAIRKQEKYNETQKEKHERDRGPNYPEAFEA